MSVAPATEPGSGARRVVRLADPVSLRLTLGPVRQGYGDPCTRFADGGLWRASRAPAGPFTMFVRSSAPDASVSGWAWGPGADWALDRLPGLVGADDDVSTFERLLDQATGVHPLVRELHRRFPGLRMGRTEAVAEFAVPVILAQKVTGLEARRSYRDLVRALGEPAPGPGGRRGLMTPPPAASWTSAPSWLFHRCGVERKRADTIRYASSYAARLDETAGLTPAEARRRLMALPGVGPWTAAEVGRIALGDPDAVSVGDYHLPNQVAWALAGRPRGDDAGMLELLEPYRGQRGRVQRLVESAGISAPRYGPRLAPASHRSR